MRYKNLVYALDYKNNIAKAIPAIGQDVWYWTSSDECTSHTVLEVNTEQTHIRIKDNGHYRKSWLEIDRCSTPSYQGKQFFVRRLSYDEILHKMLELLADGEAK